MLELLETTDIVGLRDYFQVLNRVVDEATLGFIEEGIVVRELGAGDTALVEWWLRPEAFDSFNCPDPLYVGVKTGDVVRVLRKAWKSDYALRIGYDADRGRLVFTFRGVLGRRKSVEAPATEAGDVPMPRLIYKARARLVLDDLKAALDDFKGYDYVSIHADDEAITLRSGEEIEEETPMHRHGDSVLELFVEEESKATYSLDLLAPFMRAASRVSDVATLSFSTDMPLRVDLEIRYGELVYYVAPVAIS